MKAKVKFIPLVLFITIAFAVTGSSYGNPGAKDDLQARKGLPNFFAKAQRGDSVKVAYFGGSITKQDGWRVNSLEWLKKQYPHAAFTEINAAIGGTGSDFGVFRLNEHVLKFNPDLVFVEFAVNDSHTPVEKITCSMEGIVRQIWQNNPFTDICFIYTIKETFLEAGLDGRLPYTAETMETIASHYGIPSINFGAKVCMLVRNGQLIFKADSVNMGGIRVFSRDGVHPFPETGHEIYHSVLKRSFEKMESTIRANPLSHPLPGLVGSGDFSRAGMFGLAGANPEGKWEILDIEGNPHFKSFGKYLDKLCKMAPGDSITLRFKGKAIGFYDLMGPGAGKVIVEMDGIVKDTISRFDEYCTYWRMNYFLIGQLDDKEHVAVFRVLSEPFDKAAILAKRGNVIKNPDEYKDYNWYPAKILVDGNLIFQ